MGRIIERLGLARIRATGGRATFRRAMPSGWGWPRLCCTIPGCSVLDEPANGLDPAGIVEIRELLLELTREQGVTVFMSSHILAEVARLAGRIGIIHQGRLLQELNIAELERDRQRRLVLRARDLEAAQRALVAAGQPAELLPDGTLELKNRDAIERPDEVNRLLVEAGLPPTQVLVEEEELEQYFLQAGGHGWRRCKMNSFGDMVWVESRKAVRSRLPLWTALASLFMPFGIAFLIFVSKNPEISQKLGLVSAKANLVAYAGTDWPAYLKFVRADRRHRRVHAAHPGHQLGLWP